MNGPLLGKLKNGASVYDRYRSHLHTEYPNLVQLLPEALQLVEPQDSNNFDYTHDFGITIGESICVPTDNGSDVVYAKRPHRQGLTRFVRGVAPIPVTVLTVVLKRDRQCEDEQYILVTAYIGPKAPPEPWDKHATKESIDFWNTHALVWGSLPVLEGTETVECPW